MSSKNTINDESYQGLKATNGAAHVVSTSESLLAYGNYPQYQYESGTSTTAVDATDNLEIYESPIVTDFNYHLIHNTTSADPVDVYVSVDGTTYAALAATVLLHDDVTTGGGVKVIEIPAGKVGILEGKYARIKVLKKGTTNEANSVIYAYTVK